VSIEVKEAVMSKEIRIEAVAARILVIRGKKVMLDRDLAALYGVSVKVLNQAVKRNKARFPLDFMFPLTWQEVMNSRSQIVTLKQGGNIKYSPNAFTEQGVAMLSGILNSSRAIEVNIAIMRAFVRFRELLLTHKDLAEKLAELEGKYQLHEKDIQVIFEAIRKLLEPPQEPPKPRFGLN
jgi:hypothetical protein